MVKIILNEEELGVMLREEMIREAKGFTLTQEELDRNVNEFINSGDDNMPHEYPTYALIEVQYIMHGFTIDGVVTYYNYHIREELIELAMSFPPDVKTKRGNDVNV